MEKQNYLNLNSDITKLNLSSKTTTALKDASINTIGKLIKIDNIYGIQKIKGIGAYGFKEIETALQSQCNIRLGKNIDELMQLGLSTRALNILVNKFEISTLKELLSMSIDQSSYCCLNINSKSEKEIIEKIHSLGLKFDCENEENALKVDTKIGSLRNSKNLGSVLICYETVGNILKKSFDPNNSNSVYNIRGLGEKKVQLLVEILKSYGIKFNDEENKAIISLEDLFNMIDMEVIFNEFYEKINTLSEMEQNVFVVYFTRLALSICKKSSDINYSNKEIIEFLLMKLMEYKRKMLNISNSINNNLTFVRKK